MTMREVEPLCQRMADILGLQRGGAPHDVVGAENHVVAGFVVLHAHVTEPPRDEVLAQLRGLDATVVLCIGEGEDACAAPVVVKVHRLNKSTKLI